MRELRGKTKAAIELYSFLVIVYHFVYASGLFSWLGITIGGIHPAISVGLILSILFLVFPYSKKVHQDHIPWYDWILAMLCLAPTSYYAVNYSKLLYSALTPSDLEVCLGVLMIVLCLEGVRRAIGTPLVICGLVFFLYPLMAQYLPGIFFAAPVKFRRLIGYVYLGSQGFFSAGAQVFATTIVTFVIFGQLIAVSGGGDFFLNLSLATMGRRDGGPAKAATIGSGLFGMISGVAVANVVTTGSITIPMMKKKGYSPEFAGAVETVSSTGGALMPPIMGSLAFIMADYMGVPYWSIATAAIIPAVMYYIAVYLQVSFYSSRHHLGGLDASEIPVLKTVLKDGWPFILPLFLMVFIFARYGWDAMRVGFVVILVVMGIYILQATIKRKERITVPAKGIYHAFAGSAKAMANVMPAACLAGIIMASVNLTAIGLRLSSGLLGIANGRLFILLILCAICCLIMGVAVDLIVIYIIMAVMITPAMTSLGVTAMAANLFILYYTIVGLITPPVCVATYAAASIAQSRPFRTGFNAMRLGFVALVIPFVFCYKPELLFQGGSIGMTIRTTAFTLLAIITLSAALEKYFFRFELNTAEMIWLGAAGVLLLMVPLWMNLVGVGMTAVFVVYACVTNRVSKKA